MTRFYPFVRTDQTENPASEITDQLASYQASLVSQAQGETPFPLSIEKFKVWVTSWRFYMGIWPGQFLDIGGLFLDLLYPLLNSIQSSGALEKVIIQQIPKSEAIY